MSATTTTAFGEIVVQDDAIPLGYCGGAWSWDFAASGDYQIDLTFGLSASCNFPPAESIATVETSWPSSWHMNAEMSILLVQIDPKEP